MHGGARPNAGRKKGSVTKATVYRQEMLARAAAEGLSPLEFMLDVLRDETKTFEERFEAAKAAAPYTHHRLAALQHSGSLTVAASHEDRLRALMADESAGITLPLSDDDDYANGHDGTV